MNPLEILDAANSDDCRPVTAEALLEIADVSGLTLSPDGSWVAFRVQSARATTNDYCAEWHVAPTVRDRSSYKLADAGTPVVEDGFLEGATHYGGYNPVAAWSPDSQRLAFQAHHDGRFQLCEVSRDGQAAVVAGLDGVVRALRYRHDGRSILVRSSRPVPAPILAPRPASGSGVLMTTVSRPELGLVGLPGTAEPAPSTDWVIDVGTGEWWPASAAETVELDADRVQVDGALYAVSSPDHSMLAFLSDAEQENLYVIAADGDGAQRLVTRLHACPHPLDDVVPVLWWSLDSRHLYFQARNETHQRVLYTVPIASDAPRVISSGTGELSECRLDLSRGIAVALEELPTRPAEVIAINLRTGDRRTLTDLNPAWRTFQFGDIRCIEATNQFHDRTWANLVYPVDYVPGHRYPMVVTTYMSSGFLRGASGDEYPIHVLAAHGFLVLDLTLPRSYELDPPSPDDSPTERFQAMCKDMIGPVSTIQTMVAALDREGVLDPHRLGICGFSHGSDIATYALESTNLFRAAVLSGFSHDDEYIYHLFGPGFEERWSDWGMAGGPRGPSAEHWQRRSPGLTDCTTAILSHDTEAEYLASLSAYSQLIRAGVPTEMYVYPDEDHLKIQPRHRLEIYRRTVDWFDYWLRGIEDPEPTKHHQYQRWAALRRCV
ncbi:Atxe2 family lasso peptide isopeptidase [Sciscionella marina]|uniref:Atxe2 family lasso peptide isopeptidase n=1 Tax=Sciscionella marina TaxID=508770 RepID=UPI0003A53B3D|nr:Atxe2 family lasso peptide isopeptidase [Sciscionella marina]